MENEDKVMAAIHLALGKKPDRFKPVKDFLYRVKDAKGRSYCQPLLCRASANA